MISLCLLDDISMRSSWYIIAPYLFLLEFLQSLIVLILKLKDFTIEDLVNYTRSNVDVELSRCDLAKK